jgi:alcohol dehydrogenase class IV
MRFEFATATRIVFGAGTLKEATPAARGMGDRALVVTGKSAERASNLIDSLNISGVSVTLFHVPGEPTVELALAGLETARKSSCNLVIGMGGGSALDAGKVIAALMTNPGDVYDYLEVVGKGQALVNPSAPYIAIPTTAGTGSEVTRNAVLAVTEHKVKVSLRSTLMLPRLAIVDPELTYGLPPAVTAATGFDALTQLIEPFLSSAANPVTDAICREGIRRAARSLRQAYEQGNDAAAREDMSVASLFGGMALSSARLGGVHAFAGPIGGMFPAPHGALCARLLPVVMEANLKALRERLPDAPVLERFTEVAKLLTGKPGAQADEAVFWLKDLCAALKIPALAEYGIRTADFPAIAAQAKKANSMKGNPVALSDAELFWVLENSV